MSRTSQRDRAVHLLRSSTNWLTAGALAGTGVLSVGVAMSLPGRSTSRTAAGGGAVASVSSGSSAPSSGSTSGSQACSSVLPSGSTSLGGGQVSGGGSSLLPGYSGGYRSDDGYGGGRDRSGGGDGFGSDSAFLSGPTARTSTSATGVTFLAACASNQGSQQSSPQVAAPQPAPQAPIVSSGGS